MKFTLHYLRQIAARRQLISLLLLCWVIVGTASFIHAQSHYVSTVYDQEHTATQNFECQLCAGSFQLTPFIAAFVLMLVALKAQAVRFESIQYCYQTLHLCLVGNRDPPCCSC